MTSSRHGRADLWAGGGTLMLMLLAALVVPWLTGGDPRLRD